MFGADTIMAMGIVIAVSCLWSGLTCWNPALVKNDFFRYAGMLGILAGWIMLGSAAAGRIFGSSPGGSLGAIGSSLGLAVMFLIVGLCSLPWLPFILRVIEFYVERGAVVAMSDHRLRIRPTYSKAEAAEAQKNFEGAAVAYREIIAEHPKDPEPRRRLAEVAAREGDAETATRAMAEALRLTGDVGEKYMLVIRLAELHADLARDIPAAIRALESVLQAHPKHPSGDFARQRLLLLRRRNI